MLLHYFDPKQFLRLLIFYGVCLQMPSSLTLIAQLVAVKMQWCCKWSHLSQSQWWPKIDYTLWSFCDLEMTVTWRLHIEVTTCTSVWRVALRCCSDVTEWLYYFLKICIAPQYCSVISIIEKWIFCRKS